MALPRSKYVQEGKEAVYHCFTRCVRRAFLYGFDPLTRRDFSHRKAWLVERLKQLASIFAIEVCAYAVMWNHYHVVLRTRPDILASWSDRQVAIRWLRLFPRRRGLGNTTPSPTELDICALLSCPERIAELRSRLCSLSWFMGRLNEFIARAANKEDKVTGRFWESRFKCLVLLDEAAIAACMVYVDLNPIRAGLAPTPEQSDFTSIQERIRAWYDENITKSAVRSSRAQDSPSTPFQDGGCAGKDPFEVRSFFRFNTSHGNAAGSTSCSSLWLSPITPESETHPILQMSPVDYFKLVDKSGRATRSDKAGAIDTDIAPILVRIGVKPEAWTQTISRFPSKFSIAAGLFPNLRKFAQQIGSKWLKGVSPARVAFASSIA